jgi:predicted Zn-dependent protease
MTRLQLASIAASVLLFLGLYFGFDIIPPTKGADAPPIETANDDQRVQDALNGLTEAQKSNLEALESERNETKDPVQKLALLKRISGFWYAAGNIPVAGIFAEKVAVEEKSDTAWSVAGATFYQALVNSIKQDERDFCTAHAVDAFEKAAELNPEHPEHQVNLALVYAENPPPGEGMKAVLLLRELEEKYPENASVYNALGRLAIKTNQWERAVQRLEKAYELEPNNPNTPCLLARAYEGIGDADKAAEFAAKCR